MTSSSNTLVRGHMRDYSGFLPSPLRGRQQKNADVQICSGQICRTIDCLPIHVHLNFLWNGGKHPIPKKMAENEGFEPSEPYGSTVFKTAAFDHSANSPENL